MRPPGQGCCGAVSHHLSASDEALEFMRRNIDAWWPHIEAGAEAILVTASGCGVMVKEYGELLQGDPAYAEKARRVSELARDPAEVLRKEPLEPLGVVPPPKPVAFHSPCTLQHGQKLGRVVEEILQPELSQRLLENKLENLQAGSPALIATANVGCQLHLESGATLPVKHWVELLDEAL